MGTNSKIKNRIEHNCMKILLPHSSTNEHRCIFSRLIAIPEMIETCDRYGLQKKISRFVIPLSAALKGDASGVFQAVACVFIAQLTGFNLTAGTYVIIA